jgi:2-iminobutanoate/2-iminopropanoate deaminase
MPKREIKHPDKGDRVGSPFSPGVEIDGWVFVAGHGSLDYSTGTYVPGTAYEETKRTLENLDKVLREAGCTKHDVVKATSHLADMNDFKEYNRAWREYFDGVDVLPARITTQSVLWSGMKVEVEFIARKGAGGKG